MQKKLLALAIAGAMAAPLAAQAQGSNVTIYGLLQPSVDFIDGGDADGYSMQNNNSRIGFRGSEDLGNGLKAIFTIESDVAMDEQGDGGTIANRDSFVGLSGGFGSITFGNHQSAYKKSTDFVDPMSDSIGDYNNLVSTSEEGGDIFNSRMSNSVYYTSPNFSGFQILASYAIQSDAGGDEGGFEDDDSDGDDVFTAAVTYAWGPMNFALAYFDGDEGQDHPAAGDDYTAWKIAGAYKFGTTTIAALYGDEEFGVLGGRDVIFVSLKHTMGKIDLLASYTWADEFDEVDDSGADAFALGISYGFSKRTSVQLFYAAVKNDSDQGDLPVAAYGMDSGYAPDVGEDTVSGFSVRLRHSF